MNAGIDQAAAASANRIEFPAFRYIGAAAVAQFDSHRYKRSKFSRPRVVDQSRDPAVETVVEAGPELPRRCLSADNSLGFGERAAERFLDHHPEAAAERLNSQVRRRVVGRRDEDPIRTAVEQLF